MKTILISGSTGFIARNFCKKFASKYNFILLSHKPTLGHITFDDLANNQSLISSIDVVLNLAGANIGDKRWSDSRKTEILESRVKTTGQLVELFNQYNHSAHFISASAIGIYPNDSTYDESYTVEYHKYDNFSQEITRKWEQSAKQYNGKLTITRFGVVLAGAGGAFPKMLQPFLMFAGGKIGTGEQYFSWIALPDLLNALDFIIQQSNTGIYNLTAPEAITNAQLSHNIAQVWHRPDWLTLPTVVIKSIFGQMGEELFLNSLNIKPSRLIKEEFEFQYPTFLKCIEAIRNQEIL